MGWYINTPFGPIGGEGEAGVVDTPLGPVDTRGGVTGTLWSGGGGPPPPAWSGGGSQGLGEKDWWQQMQANRPGQTNAFGSTVQWEQTPDGKWVQKQGFGGPMGQVAGMLQNRLFDLGGPVQTGDQARQQAIDAAYGQATSRLDPQWDKREDRMRTQLMNQGLDAGSEAYKSAFFDLGTQRNDAYNQAMYSAIGQGTAAGDSAFRNNMMAREAPLQELGQFRQFLNQPGFSQAGSPNLLGQQQYQDSRNADLWRGIGDAAKWFMLG